MSQFRVLLCSNSAVYSNSLRVAFQERHLFRVMEDVASDEIINSASRIQPDVVVLKLEEDACLPVIRQLLSICPLVLSVAIVEDPGRYDVNEFLNIGLKGLLPMRLLPRQIVNAVELVVVAGILCLPRMNPSQMNRNNGHNGSNVNLNSLTTRERQILGLLSKSYSNKEIAESLCLSESTVKTHLRNIFRKLNLRNRSEAMSILYGSGSNGHTSY